MGRVVNITKFGAFVNILPGRDGLVHISKLGRGKRINAVEDVLTLGQEIEVARRGDRRQGQGQPDPGRRRAGRRRATAATASRCSVGATAAAGDRRRRSSVSFEDAFDAELAGELGDLGPGGEAGGDRRAAATAVAAATTVAVAAAATAARRRHSLSDRRIRR